MYNFSRAGLCIIISAFLFGCSGNDSTPAATAVTARTWNLIFNYSLLIPHYSIPIVLQHLIELYDVLDGFLCALMIEPLWSYCKSMCQRSNRPIQIFWECRSLSCFDLMVRNMTAWIYNRMSKGLQVYPNFGGLCSSEKRAKGGLGGMCYRKVGRSAKMPGE